MEEKRAEIDARLEALAGGWRLDRQVAVDRNILRLAALEMLYVSEIPISASINEAVELAKKFSTAESGRFVNGVLGALAAQGGSDKSDILDDEADVMLDDVPEDLEVENDDVPGTEDPIEDDDDEL
jgi:N utilization substance protein B